jgi:hypothetical protein
MAVLRILGIAHNGEHAAFDSFAELTDDSREFEFVCVGDFEVVRGDIDFEGYAKQREFVANFDHFAKLARLHRIGLN